MVATMNKAVGSTARPRRYYAEIFLVSLAALLLEISYTRVISFKLFYYYTYLVIGLSLLGIGTGGVLVTISGRLKRASTEAILLWSALFGAVAVAIGYAVIARVTIDTFAIWDYGSARSIGNLLLLVLICLVLFASFVSVGVIISTLFARAPEGIGRLYFFDLVGAGLACLVVVSLLDSIGPPATIFLAALILAVTAGLIAMRLRDRSFPVAAFLAIAFAVVVVDPAILPEMRAEESKDDPAGSIFTGWSSLFRVDVAEIDPDTRLLFHDSLIGSGIRRWDGQQQSLDEFGFDEDLRALPFAAMSNPPSSELIIGAAGGHEVLASLYFGSEDIDAIELNPVTHDLVTDAYADYAGNIADHPRVDFLRDEGRSYLARSDNDYDFVWYPAPDSYSAANAATAGAFVLSESYLYTSEAIVESLEHLSSDGLIATQFGEVDFENQPNRTLRYIATAREALEDVGIENPTGHLLVATSPTELATAFVSTILVGKEPFTTAEIESFSAAVAAVPGSQVRYSPAAPSPGTPVGDLITTPDDELDGFYDSWDYEVTPVSDDAPFFWHFSSFRDVIANFSDPITRADPEVAVGERVLLLLLVVSIVLAAGFLLLPFLAIRETWKQLPFKRRSAVYFGALGLGFMFFEISLIQRLTLFLGYPTLSLTVTIGSILVFTGIGALVGGSGWRPPWLLGGVYVALVLLTAFYLFVMPEITDAFLSLSMIFRAGIAFVMLAPLGLCLGMFMPMGLQTVAGLSEHPREYVAWGWAVNGFASVVGAVLTTIVAMSVGFSVVLVVALGIYAVAVLTLRSLLRTAGPAYEPEPVEVPPPVAATP